jgi:hypothetical protein
LKIDVVDGLGVASTISDELAASIFRSTCARLAVIFHEGRSGPPQFYGGTLTGRLTVNGSAFNAKLEFKNSSDGWLKLTRKEAARLCLRHQ